MAFDVNGQVGGYGNGSLGDVTNPVNINSYAQVTSINGNTITLGSIQNGNYEKFTIGTTIIITAALTNGANNQSIGYHTCHVITAVNGNVLTLNWGCPVPNWNQFFIQAITVPNFRNITISGEISPIAYDVNRRIGGILVLRASGTINVTNGKINLQNRGVPRNSSYFGWRPLTNQENQGTNDTDLYSGWENHTMIDRWMLNVGDGTAIIVSRKLIMNQNSRIGNPSTRGCQFYRASGNSVTYNESAPAGTIQGGSNILIAADTIQGFHPYAISKYSSTASNSCGLARCYIASETPLRNDEGLYAFDCIQRPNRVVTDMNIHNYGSGRDGALTNPGIPLNNYTTINSAVTENGITKIQFSNMTSNGLTKFQEGRKVLFHVTKQRTNLYDKLGRFIMATISKIQGNFLWLSEDASRFLGDTNALVTSQYFCQLISIPEYTTLTISNNYAFTTAYNDSTHTGGIFAVAADTLNLTNGYINVEAKGGGAAYGREGLAYIGNAQDMNKLPLGQGHGSVFILAKNMMINANSRVGATYAGDIAGFGTKFGGGGSSNLSKGGGYIGISHSSSDGSAGGYNGGGSSDRNTNLVAGGGAYGGGAYGGMRHNIQYGGYGSNGSTGSDRTYSQQGAHLIVIVNAMSEFNQKTFSTGGGGGGGGGNMSRTAGQNGSSGYGGGGANDGGDGGSSGWAFFYVNQVNNIDTSGIQKI